MEIKVLPKKWGSSIAVIIPKEVIDKEHIQENKEITIEVKRRPLAGELFGLLKDWQKSAQEIKDEAREGWLSGSDRRREKMWKN